MDLQAIIYQYSVVRIEELKVTLKRSKISPLGVQKEVPEEKKEEQCSPGKKELDCIQINDSSACIRRPYWPDLPHQPTRKIPLKSPSLPAQSSQVISNTTVTMPPVKAARRHPVGMQPVKSAHRAPKAPFAPLMKKARRMSFFLQERSRRPQVGHFRPNKDSVNQP